MIINASTAAAKMIPEIAIVGESSDNGSLIRTANRQDVLDKALSRPSSKENARVRCFEIHTAHLKQSSVLATDANFQELAARAQNHTWAEIGMVVNRAKSFAMVRSYQNYEDSIEVTMDDFMNAIESIVPVLERHRLNGMVSCGDRHKLTYEKAMQLVELVEMSTGSSLVTCLLEGLSGSGKTALAATVGINSGFPFVEFVSAETMIGLDEQTKCARIVKVFEDAYKSSLSIVILDDLERLLGYAAIGPQFLESISQTLSALLKRGPPEGKKLLIIGTTSQVSFLDSVDLCDAFSVTYHVPALKTEDTKKVLEQLKVFSEDDVDAAAEALNNMPIKKLYTLIEMAAQGEHGGAAEAIYSGREKIKISHFCDCLRDVVRC